MVWLKLDPLGYKGAQNGMLGIDESVVRRLMYYYCKQQNKLHRVSRSLIIPRQESFAGFHELGGPKNLMRASSPAHSTVCHSCNESSA